MMCCLKVLQISFHLLPLTNLKFKNSQLLNDVTNAFYYVIVSNLIHHRFTHWKSISVKRIMRKRGKLIDLN
jgi:hypothetical protein